MQTADAATTAVCWQTLVEGSRSFAFASRLLPRRVRHQVAAIYSWCRRADDAVDLALPGEEQLALERLQRELSGIFRGDPQPDPTLRAFQQVVTEQGVPLKYPSELLTGMEMDVRGWRYDTLDDLYLYCYHVAGAVGVMLCHVIGVRDPSVLRPAAHLGMAMQLTNICRDVQEDWQRGRLYLPGELLEEMGLGWLISELGGPLPRRAGERLSLALRRLLWIAERFYCCGDTGLWALPGRAALAVRTARLVYSAIGDELHRTDCDVFASRAVVPPRRKIQLLGQACLTTAAKIPGRLGHPFQASRLQHELRFPQDVLPLETL
ncbi:phytoene/squalene synthase family protein [Myxococcota bacterium]